MVNFENLDRQNSYKILKNSKLINLKTALSVERIKKYQADISKDITFNYACKGVDDTILKNLKNLCEEQQVIEKYRSLLQGAVINTGENRLVLHQLTRGECLGKVIYENEDIGKFYNREKKRFFEFADKIHSGKIKGSTGKNFTTVIQIGIGGSDLGPRAMYMALKDFCADEEKMVAEFISNVDSDDANSILKNIDYQTTLFILVSKSGTTQETLTNQRFVLEKMEQTGIQGLKPSQHFVAVTSATSPLAKSKEFLESFYIDDFIGGRYSSTSAVGGVILSLAFGEKVFQDFLKGAHEVDLNSLNPNLYENATLLDAAIGVFERLQGLSSTAILPYSQPLLRFPAHLQQLDMESNGKSVNRFGKKIGYKTGPVIFGEPGTNGQHSFYQLLHQGTDTIPLQFIGFKKNQIDFDIKVDKSTSRKKLNANLVAQIIAFALGKDDKNPNKKFVGNRYSSLIYGNRLTPKALGALLAHFENKVMFQGFLWNLNSFDQEGVQLGKILTTKVLSGDMSPELQEFSKLLI